MIKAVTYITSSVDETIAIGHSISKELGPNSVVALDGDLGAGKTVLSRGITEGFGIDPDQVLSPTYTIVNEYGPSPNGIMVYHFDTYRLEGSEDFINSGLEEYLYKGGVSIIEWSDIISDILPQGTIHISIYGTGNKRTIEVKEKA